uniref:Uncharacterized protein n=1 Tax=Zea mays TaxID=4577 RepID=C4J254_MAIZE|nr:unknown [Zea mays]
MPHSTPTAHNPGSTACGFPLPMVKPLVPSGMRGPGGSLLAPIGSCGCGSSLVIRLCGVVPTE